MRCTDHRHNHPYFSLAHDANKWRAETIHIVKLYSAKEFFKEYHILSLTQGNPDQALWKKLIHFSVRQNYEADQAE